MPLCSTVGLKGPFKNPKDGERRRKSTKDAETRRKTADNVVILKNLSKLVKKYTLKPKHIRLVAESCIFVVIIIIMKARIIVTLYIKCYRGTLHS